MIRARCWWQGHPLRPEHQLVQTITGPRGVGVIVRRRCRCGAKTRYGHAVDLDLRLKAAS